MTMISPGLLIDITPQSTVMKRYEVKLYTGKRHVTTVYVYAADAIIAGQMAIKRPWFKMFTVESIVRMEEG